MGQLLTLATHCINDKRFYTSENLRVNIVHNKSDSSYYGGGGRHEELLYEINHDTIVPKGGNSWLLVNTLVSQINNKTPNPYPYLPIKGSIVINFEDEPPLVLKKKFVTTEIKKDQATVVLKEKVWKLFNKDVSYTFVYKVLKQSYEFQIVCGTITEVITEAEYDSIIDGFVANSLKLSQEADQDKINERLKQYENA